jgi:hypothetical protein
VFANCTDLLAATVSVDVAVIGGGCGGSEAGLTFPDEECPSCSNTSGGWQVCLENAETSDDIVVFHEDGGCVKRWSEFTADWTAIVLGVPVVVPFFSSTGCGGLSCNDVEVTFNG